MKDPGFQKLYEELRLGAPRGSRHALAVLMRSGVAAWMTLLSARGSDRRRCRKVHVLLGVQPCPK